jgi:hypothetical protein
MLRQVIARLGNTEIAAAALNVPPFHVESWFRGERSPTRCAIAAIWYLHSILLYPERVSNPVHILTWGRYAGPAERAAQIRLRRAEEITRRRALEAQHRGEEEHPAAAI